MAGKAKGKKPRKGHRERFKVPAESQEEIFAALASRFHWLEGAIGKKDEIGYTQIGVKHKFRVVAKYSQKFNRLYLTVGNSASTGTEMEVGFDKNGLPRIVSLANDPERLIPFLLGDAFMRLGKEPQLEIVDRVKELEAYELLTEKLVKRSRGFIAFESRAESIGDVPKGFACVNDGKPLGTRKVVNGVIVVIFERRTRKQLLANVGPHNNMDALAELVAGNNFEKPGSEAYLILGTSPHGALQDAYSTLLRAGLEPQVISSNDYKGSGTNLAFYSGRLHNVPGMDLKNEKKWEKLPGLVPIH